MDTWSSYFGDLPRVISGRHRPGYSIGTAYSYALMAVPCIPYFFSLDQPIDGGGNVEDILRVKKKYGNGINELYLTCQNLIQCHCAIRIHTGTTSSTAVEL